MRREDEILEALKKLQNTLDNIEGNTRIVSIAILAGCGKKILNPETIELQ